VQQCVKVQVLSSAPNKKAHESELFYMELISRFRTSVKNAKVQLMLNRNFSVIYGLASLLLYGISLLGAYAQLHNDPFEFWGLLSVGPIVAVILLIVFIPRYLCVRKLLKQVRSYNGQSEKCIIMGSFPKSRFGLLTAGTEGITISFSKSAPITRAWDTIKIWTFTSSLVALSRSNRSLTLYDIRTATSESIIPLSSRARPRDLLLFTPRARMSDAEQQQLLQGWAKNIMLRSKRMPRLLDNLF
jgi:hypothetical protein